MVWRIPAPNVHSSTVHNDQDMEATHVSTDRGVGKGGVVFIQCSISYKKEYIMSFATTWMNLETVTLSEVSQTEKMKYGVISLIYGI